MEHQAAGVANPVTDGLLGVNASPTRNGMLWLATGTVHAADSQMLPAVVCWCGDRHYHLGQHVTKQVEQQRSLLTQLVNGKAV